MFDFLPNVFFAGLSLIVGVVGAVVFAGAIAFAFLQKPPKQDGMQPQSLDSFGMTQASEGTVVPLLYGLNRLPGNLLYYGNLQTFEIYQKVKGGKGGISGGSSEQLQGYEYRLDVWQSIGLTSPGNSYIDLIATYIDDELATPEAANAIFNNGNSSFFPSFVPKGGKLPNVCHIGYEALFLGENRTNLPVIHFVTKTYLATGLPNENVSFGNNPAAVIYDLLIISKNATSADIDFASFQAAAIYYHSVNYACSMKITQIGDVYEVVNSILSIFPGVVYVNSEDKLVLRAFDPNSSANWTMSRNNLDYKDFKMQRQTYSQVNNDFSAKYIDMDLDYSERHVGASNDASIELVGERKPANFDFSYIRDSVNASRRIDELMKNESYPKAIVNFSANLKFKDAQPGDIIDFTNEKLGIYNLYLRINQVSRPGIASNEVKFKCTQMTERLFDSNFVDTVESDPSGIDNPVPNVEILDVFEFPYNPISEFEQIRFCLAERISGTETGFDIGYSPTRIPTPPATELEYTTVQRFLSFSMSGELQEDLNFDNFFDNTTSGLVFQPNVTFYPEFDSQDLNASYSNNTRYLLIDSEILTFATVIPIGGGNYRLTGLQRGVFGSRIRNNYPTGTEIKIFNVLDNVFDSSVLIKNLSKIQSTGLFLSKQQVPPLDTFETMDYGHSKMVGIPCYIEITKTGASLSFEVYPTVNANNGFGRGTPNTVVPRSIRSMPPNGKIRVFYDRNDSVYNDFSSVSFSDSAPDSGAHEVNLQVIEIRDGSENRSQYVSFNVGASDGLYVYNSYSKWSRKEYDVLGSWVPTYIGDRESE